MNKNTIFTMWTVSCFFPRTTSIPTTSTTLTRNATSQPMLNILHQVPTTSSNCRRSSFVLHSSELHSSAVHSPAERLSLLTIVFCCPGFPHCSNWWSFSYGDALLLKISPFLSSLAAASPFSSARYRRMSHKEEERKKWQRARRKS